MLLTAIDVTPFQQPCTQLPPELPDDAQTSAKLRLGILARAYLVIVTAVLKVGDSCVN
jgi:hypothetical protein